MCKTPGIAFAAALALVACDRTIIPTPGGSANYSAALGADPDFSRPHGRVVAETWLDYDQNSLSGAFAAGPPLELRTESQRIGNCRLMAYEPTVCRPACTGGDLCVDGECRSYPERLDRGSLRWIWPDGERTIEPDDLLYYAASGTTSEPGGSSITFDGITLEAPTIDGADPIGDWARDIGERGDGDDVTLRWSNPIDKARVRLSMTDCTGSHGGIGEAEIECEGPDTGELVLPGAFLDALDAGDWSHGECGSHPLERYHAAAIVGDDTVRYETVGDSGFFYRPGW